MEDLNDEKDFRDPKNELRLVFSSFVFLARIER